MAGSAAGAIAIVLLFAAATPMIEPSALSIGTLFSYLGAVAILVAYAAMLLIRAIVGVKSKAEGVSLGAESVAMNSSAPMPSARLCRIAGATPLPA